MYNLKALSVVKLTNVVMRKKTKKHVSLKEKVHVH